jgi:hypothetical protein
MKPYKFLSLLAFLVLSSGFSKLHAQSRNDSDLVQFTGFVVNHDSTKTIPFATIRINGTSRGTYSDMQGYFSFVAKRSDVLIFTCIGFEPRYFRIPASAKGNKIKSVVALQLDSFIMEDVVIHGYPTPEQMDYMFSRSALPNDAYQLAQNNLRRKPLADISMNMSYDAQENANWRFNDYANKAYYNGQPQPIPVLDVMAWGKFIKALENGDFKRK